MGTIYALRQSGTSEVRYVGKTTKTPALRLDQHKRKARNGGRAYLHKWLRSIGFDAEVVVLEADVSIHRLDDRERAWIAELRANAARLTNLTEGGEGGATWLGRRHTPETLAKMSESRRKRPPLTAEQREKLKGRRHTPETIAKMSAAKKGRPHSAEHTAAIAASRRGRPLTAEHRAAISRANKGKPSPQRGIPKSEDHRAKIRAAHTGPDGGCRKGHHDWESNGIVNGRPQRTCRTCRRERNLARSRTSDPYPWVTG